MQKVQCYGHVSTHAISSYTISDLSNVLKSKKVKIITLFKIAPYFTKVEDEYCWAITEAAWLSCCGRSGCSVLRFGFHLDSLIYTHTSGHKRTQFRVAQNST
jgi:hypothetical protein